MLISTCSTFFKMKFLNNKWPVAHMYMCICIYVHLYIRKYEDPHRAHSSKCDSATTHGLSPICIHTYVYTYGYICIQTCVHMRVYMYKYIYINTHLEHIPQDEIPQQHACRSYVCISTYIHIYIYVCTCIYMHRYI